MTEYVLVGGGAFAREAHDWFAPGLAERGHRFVGYLDDTDQPMRAFGRALPQLGRIADAKIDAAWRLVMAIGDCAGKAAVVERLGAGAFETLVHESAWVAASAKVGRGCTIGPYAMVSADSAVGDFVSVNAHSSVGHDVKVGAYSTLSCYVDLTGWVSLGERVFAGSGARVIPKVSVGDGCTLGAGAVIVRNAPAGAVYYAAPARRL